MNNEITAGVLENDACAAAQTSGKASPCGKTFFQKIYSNIEIFYDNVKFSLGK